jgi:hypothetical protein
MITVYHNMNPFALLGNLNPFGVADLNTLVKVAQVDTEDLDEAFELTNHLGQSWTLNPQVKAEAGQYRSTSVGDVLERGGVRYRVESSGFSEV